VKRKSQTKFLEIFGPRPVAPLIDPEAIWTIKLRDEIGLHGAIGFFRRIVFASRLLNGFIAESRDTPDVHTPRRVDIEWRHCEENSQEGWGLAAAKEARRQGGGNKPLRLSPPLLENRPETQAGSERRWPGKASIEQCRRVSMIDDRRLSGNVRLC